MARKPAAAERGAALQALKAALKSGEFANLYVFSARKRF